MTTLLDLPPELLCLVCDHLSEDLPEVRLVCKEIMNCAEKSFGMTYFKGRFSTVHDEAFASLLDIVSHPTLGKYVDTLILDPLIPMDKEMEASWDPTRFAWMDRNVKDNAILKCHPSLTQIMKSIKIHHDSIITGIDESKSFGEPGRDLRDDDGHVRGRKIQATSTLKLLFDATRDVGLHIKTLIVYCYREHVAVAENGLHALIRDITFRRSDSGRAVQLRLSISDLRDRSFTYNSIERQLEFRMLERTGELKQAGKMCNRWLPENTLKSLKVHDCEIPSSFIDQFLHRHRETLEEFELGICGFEDSEPVVDDEDGGIGYDHEMPTRRLLQALSKCPRLRCVCFLDWSFPNDGGVFHWFSAKFGLEFPDPISLDRNGGDLMILIEGHDASEKIAKVLRFIETGEEAGFDAGEWYRTKWDDPQFQLN